MFCVLLRGGFVSALYRICSFIATKCVYIFIAFLLTVASFQLALISFHCFESFLWLDRLPRSFAGGSSMEKALNLRLFAKSWDHPQWRSGYVRSGQTEGTGFKSC